MPVASLQYDSRNMRSNGRVQIAPDQTSNPLADVSRFRSMGQEKAETGNTQISTDSRIKTNPMRNETEMLDAFTVIFTFVGILILSAILYEILP